MTSSPLTELLSIPETRRAALVEIVGRARSARHVVLTTHVNSDGDGTGSEAAVAAWLESVGVRVTIINPTPFPANFRFLLHRDDIVADLDDPRVADEIADADLALVLDTSESNRVAPVDELLAGIPTFVVDHHPPGPTVVGSGGVQDASAAATGELVYDMITVSGDAWPAASVLGAYVAIVSDTGSFRFANTRPRTHAIAAELLARGVDPEQVYQRLFAVAPPRRLQLLREALGRLEHEPALGLAWIVVPWDVSHRLGSTSDDFEGLIDHARSIEGTRVALLFRGIADGKTKISFRSSGSIDVNRIARKFGGGGHIKASGATVAMPIGQAVESVLAAVRQEL